ncbi:uncharacterized protein E0L32_002443 [Thyridium curvatum]|uniref:Uncharacterized protein n=1 Tax=Thyridium curvatum TaxID=1093900 RepID=A0A507BGV3_9PEZI|nr:uncharacterized protein E0L32_002443 [Thyridium curvatum]TPX18586.1 hypothetical protein E0L32_002443 [Thyridium curvatum]
MLFSKIFTLTALAASYTLAEEVFLSNCHRGSQARSAMFYYPGTYDGTIPPNNNQCFLSSYNDGPIHWEGTKRSCKFPTGVTFTSNLIATAHEQSYNTLVGTGDNGKPWDCYRDNDVALFTLPDGGTCFTIYRCFPV